MHQTTASSTSRRAPTCTSAPDLLARLAAAALLPFALTACAPDAWKSSPGGNSFMDQIQRTCGNLRMGEATVNDLMDPNSPSFSPPFLDLTSRWDAGKMDKVQYRQSVMAARGGPEPAGLSCILNLKP